MRAIVVYDSVYGNTEKIAKAIGEGLAAHGSVRTARAGSVSPADLKGTGLVVIGAPTQGGRPTPIVQTLLDGIPAGSLKGTKFATFDTRMGKKGAMRVFTNIFGFAAGRIAQKLGDSGGTAAAPPEGFFVKGREGPLEDGELERARGWAQSLLAGK